MLLFFGLLSNMDFFAGRKDTLIMTFLTLFTIMQLLWVSLTNISKFCDYSRSGDNRSVCILFGEADEEFGVTQSDWYIFFIQIAI